MNKTITVTIEGGALTDPMVIELPINGTLDIKYIGHEGFQQVSTSQFAAQSRRFLNKYVNMCEQCGEDIRKGEPIIWWPDHQGDGATIIHASCPS